MKFFENLNFISNIFREPCDFLIFTGPVTIYISLRSSQPKVPRKKTKTVVLMIRGTFVLKITKMGFGILINHFWEPFFTGFYCLEGISYFYYHRTKIKGIKDLQ